MLRAYADAENAPASAAQTEAAPAQKYALERFAEQLLPVVDSLQAALGSENTSREALRNGVELTLKQLGRRSSAPTSGKSVRRGRAFRPHRHHAGGGGRGARLETQYRGLAHAERLHAA